MERYPPFASLAAQQKAAETNPLAALEDAADPTRFRDAVTGGEEAGASTQGCRAPGTGLLVDKRA
jgi:hypothetical protein